MTAGGDDDRAREMMMTAGGDDDRAGVMTEQGR